MLYDWRLLGREKIFSRGFIDIYRDKYSKKEGEDGSYFYVMDLPDWINIVAVTKDKRVLLIKQYRFGTRSFHIEIPGGAIDKTDKDPLASARRELLEETGYSGGKWTRIGQVEPNPAIQSNRCFTYLADGVEFTQEPSFDDNEDIETIPAGMEEAYRMVETGEISHSLVVCALMYAQKYLLNR